MCIRDRVDEEHQLAAGAGRVAGVDLKAGGGSEAGRFRRARSGDNHHCLLYTSDAADERSSVDLGGRRIIKKKKNAGEAEMRRDGYTI